MALPFVNRERELRELDQAARTGGLTVVYGRRRVGKTRLLGEWLRARGGLYSQAIEATRDQQIRQIYDDVRSGLTTGVEPRTWDEFLEVLRLQTAPWIACLDEFPYLAAVDSSLPSRLQRWIDHSLPDGCLLILAGSSTRMMNDLFLRRGAPLYGRARKLLPVRPMDYAAFCQACRRDRTDPESFEMFACVGGVPRYWEFVESGHDPVGLAESLYFGFAPYMEEEPHRILRDEGSAGLNAVAVLEAVGRGAERPSEVASRLGTAQTNLSRVFQQLLDASILVRDLPFGESVRSTRKVLYRIDDPTMRFWFRVYSPHRTRWRTYSKVQKRRLIHEHAATVFEDACRRAIPGACRYWENDLKLDLVGADPQDGERLLVAEIKWGRLTEAQLRRVRRDLEAKWDRCGLRARHPVARLEVMDASLLDGGMLDASTLAVGQVDPS